MLGARGSWRCADLGDAVVVDGQLEREAGELQGMLAERRPPIVYLWRSQAPSIVASRRDALLPGFAAAVRALDRAGIPVHTRATGGGACPQGPDILNVSAVYAIERDARVSIDGSYRWFCGRFLALLEGLGVSARLGALPGTFCDGRFNVLADGRKLIGTAQRWRRSEQRIAVLCHALLLLARAGEAVESVREFYALAGAPRPLDAACATSFAALGIRDPARLRGRLRALFSGTGDG